MSKDRGLIELLESETEYDIEMMCKVTVRLDGEIIHTVSRTQYGLPDAGEPTAGELALSDMVAHLRSDEPAHDVLDEVEDE